MDFLQYFKDINSWQELHSLLQTKSEKEKGDCFELLTKYALKLIPKYSTQLKNVWLSDELPTREQEYLNRAIRDIGTDLIAETNSGEYWAIQCKYHGDEDRSLTHSELSTFLSDAFVRSDHFSFGLVCSNANRYSKYYEDVERIGFACNDFYNDLDKDFFENVRKDLLGQKLKEAKPYKPFPHQKRAISNGIKHFIKENNERGKLIFPCGSGKSLTGYWLSQKLKASSILVCVPSLALIKQTLETWLRESVATKTKIDWICVCSDTSIGKSDDVAVFTKDLGVPVTTDVGKISSWLKGPSQRKVVFTTYQSGEVISKASDRSKTTFDLAIFDEAHKTVGRKDKLFSKLLFEEHINIRQRLFMTATERRYRGMSDEISSMDDYNLYGETFERLSFKEALELKPQILSDYKIITISVSEEEIEELINSNAYVKPDKGSWSEDVEARTLASLIGLRKAMSNYPIKHAVSFHGSISKAKAFEQSQEKISNLFPQFKPIEHFHVSGSVPTSKRSKIVKEFTKSKRALITNAKCLTEGIDVPKIDCVLFADPRKSTIDIVQAVGRALRLFEGKKYGYVILPFIVRGEKLQAEENDFSKIVSVLRALASNDDRIIEWFRSIANKKKVNKGIIKFDIDERLADKIDIATLTEDLELQIWDKLAKMSWRPFDEAREYVHGLNLKSQNEWRAYTKINEVTHRIPLDIPMNPDTVYKDGWLNWGDWLGTGTIASQNRGYQPFETAREFVRKLGLKGRSEWREYCKSGEKPDDIPTHPDDVYKNKGWVSIGDWLGTGTIAPQKKVFRTFEKAREFARNLNLKNNYEWREYCKSGEKPDDIPANPENIYANSEWNGYPNWLGNRQYKSFEDARIFVHNLGLKGSIDWRIYCDSGLKPDDIPKTPSTVYKNKGWVSMGDWLGTGTIAPQKKVFRTFEKAREFARNLKLKSNRKWREYCNSGSKPDDIPTTPERVYRNKGWRGYGDWLGTENIGPTKRKFRDFIKARNFVRILELKNQREWRKYCKSGNRPHDIPGHPDFVYKNQWKGMNDWLSKDDK